MSRSLYTLDTETDGLIYEFTHFHTIFLKEYHVDHYVLFLDPERDGYDEACQFARAKKCENLEIFDIDYFPTWLKKSNVGAIACHNLYGFDLIAMKLLLGIKSTMFPKDTINGRHIRLIDTLSMSRYLYPDRPMPKGCPSSVKNAAGGKARKIGPHGLEAWGWRVGNHKVPIDDWRLLPLKDYVNRVWEDVVINEKVYDALIAEMNQSNRGINISWKDCLHYGSLTDFLMHEQATHGSVFNKEGAIKLLAYIDQTMLEIQNEVEPKLPVREKTGSNRVEFVTKPFTQSGDISKAGWQFAKNVLGFDVNLEALDLDAPPKKSFKRDGSLSATAIKWCIAHGVEDTELMPDFVREQRHIVNTTKPVPDEILPKLKAALKSGELPESANLEPMKISNQDDIKAWLYTDAGWVPTMWNLKDVTKDDHKQQLSDDAIEAACRQYLMERLAVSVYRTDIEKLLGFTFNELVHSKTAFAKFCRKKARRLPTTPKLRDRNGNLCENLAKIDSEMGKGIVKWLSLRNRRSVIKTLDPKKNTGWLNHPRLAIDGRLPTTFSGITNTGRRKHSVCANVPKPKPDVLLGYEMRDLWTVPAGYYQLGCDACNLENMVAAWWAWVFGKDGGDYYAVVSQGDSHQINANAYSKIAGHEISRDKSKPITYGILYGCAGPKAAEMLGVPTHRGQEVIDAFWDANPGLKSAKEYLEKEWEKSGKRFIRGIDGRRIYTRSKSSLLNAAFQSTGAICIDRAGIHYKEKSLELGLEDKGIYRIIYYHDEYQLEVPEKQVRMKPFELGFEAPKDAAALVKSANKQKDLEPGEWIVQHSELKDNQADKLITTMKECSDYMKTFEGGKYQLAGKPFIEGSTISAPYCVAGQLIAESIQQSSRELGAPFEITGEYLIGRSWAGAH